MKVRSIDRTKDWQLGKGKNDYKKDVNAVIQMIETRLKSFLGDCFFDLAEGIDWFYFNGSKDSEELKIAITARILNTPNVISASEVITEVGKGRIFLIQFTVNTIYGQITDTVEQEV